MKKLMKFSYIFLSLFLGTSIICIITFLSINQRSISSLETKTIEVGDYIVTKNTSQEKTLSYELSCEKNISLREMIVIGLELYEIENNHVALTIYDCDSVGYITVFDIENISAYEVKK